VGGPRVLRFNTISRLKENYDIKLLVDVFSVNPSSYYKWTHRKVSLKEVELKKLIYEIFQSRKGIYGYRRITDILNIKYKITINHKKVYRIMRELGIKARIRRKRAYNDYKDKVSEIAPNILQQEFKTNKLNEKWVTDLSYIALEGKKYCLSVIQDLFNNEIIAYKIGKGFGNSIVFETVKQAIQDKNYKGVILHSDQGGQYTSRAYQGMVKKLGITPSMSRKGNCLDNACVESFFGHYKSEMLHLLKPKNFEDLKKETDDYMRFYNHERMQRRLKKMAPVEYRNHLN